MSQITTEEAPKKGFSLDVDEVKKELTVADSEPALEGELQEKVDATLNKFLSIDATNHTSKMEGVKAIEQMGAHLQKMASRRSNMLNQSIATLSRNSEDGGPVATSLLALRDKVEELDPNKFDFSVTFIRRLLSALPFIGTPISKYFAQYQSAETVIADIVKSLEKGREQLKHDNITLADDQLHFKNLNELLKTQIAFAMELDKKLSEKIDLELTADDPKTIFLKEEVLFPLRQRIQDLQQQRAVAQQAVLTIEVVIRNNKELIRGVNRALSVTVNALQTAVTLALALANQKITLEKIEAINDTTNNLISSTAAKLKQQGAEIHKKAASAQLDMQKLKAAFQDINAALEDISKFRQDALPKMASTIIEMNEVTKKADESVKKFENAEDLSDDEFGLEIVDLDEKKL
ncbi:toxic anion resistance protein [Pleionea sediminis]|uniref:toxic anion resistance protein n=1 Tax=Pleionea sediminis TaxID=2569479 RepID=UPI001185162B|nr:toxic anion resistance protein [Pleionea sediminis]